MTELSTTSVAGNPVAQIAELLSPAPEPKKVEIPTDSEPTVQDTPDESSDTPTDNNLSVNPEAEVPEMETTETDGDIDTLNNLAEQLDLPVEDLYALNVNMGQDNPAMTLGKLKDFYEANSDIDTTRETLELKQNDLQREFDAQAKIPQVTNEVLNAKAQMLSIRNQYENINWQELRQTNPAEFSALQNDFNTMYSQAEQQLELANNEASYMIDDSAKYQQDILFDYMPELKDDNTRIEAANAINNLASQYGFTSDDIGNITDNRLIRLLIDASKMNIAKQSYGKQKQDNTPESLSSIPSNAVATNGRKASLQRLTEKAKQTGDRRDQTAAIAALLS